MEHSLKSSSFYSELHSLPLFKSAEKLYVQIKESSRLASAGLTVLEYSCTTVIEKLYDGSTVAQNVDKMAGQGVAKLVDRYPALCKSPDEIQEKTSSVVKDTVRSVMRTPTGRVIIKSLDWVVDRTEGLLLRVKPHRPKSPRKKKITRSQTLGKDHAYALDDSGACDSETRPPNTKSASIPVAVEKLTEPYSQAVVQKLVRLTCIVPLETMVHLLKSVRRYAGGKRRKMYTKGRSPSDKDGRRKVSPKKKVSSSILGKLTHHALSLFGYPGVGKRITFDPKHGSSSPSHEDSDEKPEKKRKHEEILSDQDSDASEEDMANFDFDGYESEEDPDYQPSESESDLSVDISEGETESDIEPEPVIPGQESLVQIKDDKKPEEKDKSKESKDTSKGEKNESKPVPENKQKDEKKKSPDKKLGSQMNGKAPADKKPEHQSNGKGTSDKKPDVKTGNVILPSSGNVINGLQGSSIE